VKERFLYLLDFGTRDEARQVTGQFVRDYGEWLIDRYGPGIRSRCAKLSRYSGRYKNGRPSPNNGTATK
jgi:hypothetical protein